jgi:hypothetical protein
VPAKLGRRRFRQIAASNKRIKITAEFILYPLAEEVRRPEQLCAAQAQNPLNFTFPTPPLRANHLIEQAPQGKFSV